jgi:hypothetical protein
MEQEESLPPHDIQKYRRILEIICDYKIKLIEEFTKTSQDPSILQDLPRILLPASKSIINFVVRNEEPINPDENLKECIEALKKETSVWNSDITILIHKWCDIIFNEYMFSDIEVILSNYK